MSPDGKPQPELSAEYFKKAGYASGKYEGTEKILMVGSNAGVAAKVAEVAKENFEKMGFVIQMRLVQQQTMYTRYCNTPAAKVAICPNVGWNKDFADGQTMISPIFAGKNILEQGNSNWSQLDVPAINEAIDAAEILPNEQRAAAWAAINKMVVAEAPAVPYIWDNTPLIQSDDVNGVVEEANAQWGLAWSSLK
jgi:peptide/nickel transport system substrate-binding protein